MIQKQRQTLCSVSSKYTQGLLPDFNSGGLEKYLHILKISNICINIRLVNNSIQLSCYICADVRGVFTVCCHSLPQVLLQSALCVLQLKLLGTIRWHIRLITS